jgi:hypothetical protein
VGEKLTEYNAQDPEPTFSHTTAVQRFRLRPVKPQNARDGVLRK